MLLACRVLIWIVQFFCSMASILCCRKIGSIKMLVQNGIDIFFWHLVQWFSLFFENNYYFLWKKIKIGNYFRIAARALASKDKIGKYTWSASSFKSLKNYNQNVVDDHSTFVRPFLISYHTRASVFVQFLYNKHKYFLTKVSFRRNEWIYIFPACFTLSFVINIVQDSGPNYVQKRM